MARFVAVRVHDELLGPIGDLVDVCLVVDTEFPISGGTEGWAISRHLDMVAAKAAATLLNAQ